MSRNKGASYEREVAAQLGTKRKLGQARDGGNDLETPDFIVECKRRKTLGFVSQWFKQVLASVKPGDIRTPVVVMREDNGESLVALRLTDLLKLLYEEDAALLVELKDGQAFSGFLEHYAKLESDR